MATYKVIQDIEAEDKLLGPLTFRQFVYAGASVLFFYLSYLAATKNAGFMLVVFLPLAFSAGFFAWPWSRDQPTEIWALAKIRFLVKPRIRIWNQSGVKELVTVTAPKKVEMIYTNGLSQDEVHNRLRALADTIDSRGWATKNVNISLYDAGVMNYTQPSSDRLLQISSLPQTVPEVDIQASDDMLEESNPVARQFDTMIAASTKAHREEILEHLRDTGKAKMAQQEQAAQGQSKNDYWFLNQPANAGASVARDAVTFNTQVVTPGTPASALPASVAAAPFDASSPDEQALMEKLHQEEQRQNISPYTRLHTIQPLSQQPHPQPGQPGSPQFAAQFSPPMPSQGFDPGMMVGPPGSSSPVANGAASMNPQTTPTYPTPQMPAPYSSQQNGQSQTTPSQVTQAPDPAILQLASNDDLDVATIAREANKRKELQDEVVISLH